MYRDHPLMLRQAFLGRPSSLYEQNCTAISLPFAPRSLGWTSACCRPQVSDDEQDT